MPQATITVRAQPGAKQTELAAVREGVPVVRVAARAHEGQANAMLCKFLAGQLGVRAAQVTIVRGERSRDKVIRVDGVDQATVETKLGI